MIITDAKLLEPHSPNVCASQLLLSVQSGRVRLAIAGSWLSLLSLSATTDSVAKVSTATLRSCIDSGS